MFVDLARRCEDNRRRLARRWFLQQCGVGLGAVALADLTGPSVRAETDPAKRAQMAKEYVRQFPAGK